MKYFLLLRYFKNFYYEMKNKFSYVILVASHPLFVFDKALGRLSNDYPSSEWYNRRKKSSWLGKGFNFWNHYRITIMTQILL